MRYLLSLGSNEGNREENLKDAILALNERGVRLLRDSYVYETSPVDYEEQDDFLNMAIVVETNLMPDELLKEIKEVEAGMGRVSVIPKGPRVIDIDIVFWSGGEFSSPRLTVPHERAFERLFVLVPAMDVVAEEDGFLYEVQRAAHSLEDGDFEGQEVKRRGRLYLFN